MILASWQKKYLLQSSSSSRQPNYKPAKLAIAALPEDTDEDGIPGEAGVNYPTLHTIPRTSFSCGEQQHNGYYADLETSCQVKKVYYKFIYNFLSRPLIAVTHLDTKKR